MTDPNDRKRWESLWDELGLPAEAPSAAPTAAAPTPPVPPAEPPLPSEPASRPPETPRRFVVTPPPRVPSAEATCEPFPEPCAEPLSAEAVESMSAQAEPEGDGAREGGKRRRRRRRRRSSRQDDAQPTVSAGDTGESGMAHAGSHAEHSEPSPHERRDRDRGPRRREQRPWDSAEMLEEAAADSSPLADDCELERSPVADADADSGPPEDFSDLNLPSWNELIASLHRPQDR